MSARWLALIAGAVAVVVVVVLAWTWPSGTPTEPWTDLGGKLGVRCEGTTAIYVAWPSGSIDAVPGDPYCAEVVR